MILSAREEKIADVGIHSIWISCSSSVILFNKWLLDTLNFRKLPR